MQSGARVLYMFGLQEGNGMCETPYPKRNYVNKLRVMAEARLTAEYTGPEQSAEAITPPPTIYRKWFLQRNREVVREAVMVRLFVHQPESRREHFSLNEWNRDVPGGAITVMPDSTAGNQGTSLLDFALNPSWWEKWATCVYASQNLKSCQA